MTGPADRDVAALVAAGEPGPDNPMTVAAVFWTAVTEPDGPDLEVLELVVTPESWRWWNGFHHAGALLRDRSMAPAVTASADDPDVVHLSFGEEQSAGPGEVVATLVRARPGGWRVHALGPHGNVR